MLRCCPTYVAAPSQTRGAAATLRDRSKEYRAHKGHTFVIASVETYRHFGRPITRFLRTLLSC
jgi:hypothetical protein